MNPRPAYARVLWTFFRNSLVRDMTFRSNFIIDLVSSTGWMLLNLTFYVLIYSYTPRVAGWGKYEFLLFVATGLLINSLVQTFFMTNADEFSELIRRGELDFVLLKPIDAQFLVSLRRIDWSSLGNFFLALVLLSVSLAYQHHRPTLLETALYPLYVLCGVAIYYSLMLTLSAASVWMGRNLTLLDFWFYLTNFSRYPMDIYRGPWGTPLRQAFTFIIPVLVVVNVPSEMLARPLHPASLADWFLPGYTLLATIGCLAVSRLVFQRALASYRSASS
jgi:ABC-2 type transport system permease protein